jgi:hypothetical protein
MSFKANRSLSSCLFLNEGCHNDVRYFSTIPYLLCQVGQLEGVQLVLDCSQMDAKNPFITQWAVLAIRVGTLLMSQSCGFWQNLAKAPSSIGTVLGSCNSHASCPMPILLLISCTSKLIVCKSVLWIRIPIRIRIRRSCMFLGLPDPHPDPLVTSTDPAPDPSIK